MIDDLILQADRALKTICGNSVAERENPAQNITDNPLDASEQELSGRLMRVNHVGEVCAQALYQGQAMTARHPAVQQSLEQAAREETDHLAWCEQRLDELDTRKSLLNPLWFFGSFSIGAIAGLAGDRWSLGFVAETERQVERHLDSHLEKLPEKDTRSRVIVTQMREDEINHGKSAKQAGGESLPKPVKQLMGIASRIMTRTAFWL